MSKSKIEWTEQTANPIIGCSKCSTACKNCYALTMVRRLAGMKGPAGYDYRCVVMDGEWNGNVMFITSVLDKIIRRKKPTTYFIGSMTDIFHESVPDYWIDQIMETIAMCPQHRFMLLTKRPEMMSRYAPTPRSSRGDEFGFGVRSEAQYPPPNLALGVSVWDQASADHAIPLLLQTPAARRFVSAEPLLGAFDLCKSGGIWSDMNNNPVKDSHVLGHGIDLLIVGGETGPGARPMHPDWARSLRDQCASAGVPFMFKGWGNCMPCHYDKAFRRVRKEKAGRLLDGVEHNGAIQWEAAR